MRPRPCSIARVWKDLPRARLSWAHGWYRGREFSAHTRLAERDDIDCLAFRVSRLSRWDRRLTADLTADRFEAVRGTSFRTRSGDVARPDLRLETVDRLEAPAGAPRQEPFALVFAGPPPVLDQRTYTLIHDELGEVDIFLVPIGFGPDGSVHYEAVFN